MSKFITFNGVTLYHPGGLTKVDAAGMAQVGAGASGIVGVIGEADYGQPHNPDDGEPKIYEFTDPDAMAETFKSGPLADAVDFLFNPANDVRIPGGAQKVFAIKSNIDTKSTNILVPDQANANSSLTLESATYGKFANALAVKVARNELDTDTLDVSVEDGNSGVTETFTQICGKPLLDVQYAPSTPTQIGAEVTAIVGSAFNTLEVGVAANTLVQVGQYVQITEGEPLGAQNFFIGQTRRVTNNAGTTITVGLGGGAGGGWSAVGGVVGGTAPLVGTKFIVIREAIGPFDVATYNSGTFVIAASSDPTATPTGPSFAVNDTAIGDEYYGQPTNGPCYVHVVSGAGAGQIRRIATTAEAVALTLAQGLVTGSPLATDYSIQLTTAFATDLDTTSKFVFINAVPLVASPTFTGSVMTGEGAVGTIAGTLGKANSLVLSVRPGLGEPVGLTGAGVWMAAGAAGALRTTADWTIALSDDLNVNALVTGINLSTVAVGNVKNTTDGAWVARVGLGRDPAAATSRFDWTGSDTVNGLVGASSGVDCLCDFGADHPASNETGDYGGTPNRYHRFVDNLALLVDTLNAQSSLVTAARATAAALSPIAGGNYGDGVPAFGTYSLTGGAQVATTAAGLKDCFDELIKHRQDSAVALWSQDSTKFALDYVHSLLATHASNGAGAYKNEVDVVAAVRPVSTSSEDLAMTLIQTKAAVLNNRNVALVFQDIKRAGLNGSVNQYEPHMLACAIAGMQAGSTVGTPLTFKVVNAVDILCQNLRVDTLDKNTSDLLLQNGILFTEKVKGKGHRVVKNISTYTATDNVAYTDRNVNYELNYMSYDLRTFIEDRFIGEKGTPATVTSIKSALLTKLEIYKSNLEIIVNSQDSDGNPLNAYRNIKVTISGDICTIRFEIFPAVGINYVTFEIFAKLPTLSA